MLLMATVAHSDKKYFMKGDFMKRCYFGFTLAEVLITLAIIGVVAALSIPAVISNSQQQEFKTGLRKAVSVLNSAITMNMALDGESPYDNANLFGYLMKHMSVMKTTTNIRYWYCVYPKHAPGDCYNNAAFYTTDGMRFDFRLYNNFAKTANIGFPLYESDNITGCAGNTTSIGTGNTSCGGCGSYGLNNNSDNTTKPPCMVIVDVNGDKKPNPANINCIGTSNCTKDAKYSDPLGLKLTDMFTIMITDKQAIPYGVAAQRAMYQARK